MINKKNLITIFTTALLFFLSGCGNEENKNSAIEYMNNIAKKAKSETVKEIAIECKDMTINLIDDIHFINNEQIILALNSFDFCFLNNRVLILEEEIKFLKENKK